LTLLIIVTSYLSVGAGVYFGVELITGSSEFKKMPLLSSLLWFVLIWPYTLVIFKKD